MKKLFSLLLATVLLFALAACGQSPQSAQGSQTPADQSETGGTAGDGDELRVAFLYDTPVTDGGWITSHDLGRQAVEAMEGVSTTYADNVTESDCWNYMNNFAKEGYDVIFACSFGYMHDCLAVSKENPDTVFMHCSGYELTDNMGAYFGRNYEGAYLAGMAAASVAENGLIGYIGTFPIAEVVRNVNAYALGAKAVNPDVQVQLVWLNAWYDPTLASDAAETLIAAGCEALFHYENSPAIVQTAAKRGVYAVGQHADASQYSAEYCLTSSLWKWDVLYTEVVKSVQDGTWAPEEFWWGMAEGVVDIAPLNPAIPQEVQDQIMEARQKLVDGDETGNPFYGEVKNQAGEVVLPEGTDATMGELMEMDYFVDNVIDVSDK